MDSFNWDEYQLDQEQQYVLQKVISGKSIFLTGAAGTGKSLLLKYIIHVLQLAYPNQQEVAITAPTGIASFPLGGYTLHSWAGLEPSSVQYPIQDIIKSIRNRRHIIKRWSSVKVLLIDEISLVSGALFLKLNQLAQHFKKNNQLFGGIQVIACGDFLQLPPIEDNTNEGRYCFMTDAWKQLFHNNVYCLQKIHRSIDPEWTSVLNELRCGDLSAESRVILKSRIRQSNSPDLKGIRLFPRRNQVDEWNQQCLDSLPGNTYVWNATEVGDEYDKEVLERSCLAPKKLILKIGSPVLLLKNINQNHGLVNGRQGIVSEIIIAKNAPLDSSMEYNEQVVPGHRYVPVIMFGSYRMVMEPAEWNYKNGYIIKATRMQFPLLLADSISTHKAQGMTLDEAVVDLRGIFESGQAYVGLSRVRSLAGLFCLNVIPFQVIKADKNAVAYWNEVKERVPLEIEFDETLPKYLWVGWQGEYENKNVMVLPPDEGIWRIWVIGTEEVIQGELTTEEWIIWCKKTGRTKSDSSNKQLDLRIWYRKTK